MAIWDYRHSEYRRAGKLSQDVDIDQHIQRERKEAEAIKQEAKEALHELKEMKRFENQFKKLPLLKLSSGIPMG